MRILKGEEERQAREYLEKCIQAARDAGCFDAKCGSVIVKTGKIIGTGCNSPPRDLKSQKRCEIPKDSYHKKVTDKTCCIHAEQRAIIDALKKFPQELDGASLYFIRVDEKGERLFAGQPFCTICSKLALDVGIKEWILWHKEGICVYESEEYNGLSYQYSDEV